MSLQASTCHMHGNNIVVRATQYSLYERRANDHSATRQGRVLAQLVTAETKIRELKAEIQNLQSTFKRYFYFVPVHRRITRTTNAKTRIYSLGRSKFYTIGLHKSKLNTVH